jgi:hypothetical protein
LYIAALYKLLPEVKSRGGDIVCITSQDEEKVELARTQTGAAEMKFISDHDKKLAGHFGIHITPTDKVYKGSELSYKDNSISQWAVLILNKQAEVVYTSKAEEDTPFGRPEPAALWSAVSTTLTAGKGAITEKGLAANVSSLTFLGKEETMALIKASQ